MPKHKTAVIIVARCKSERFPNKVIANLGNKPVIVHLIDKAKLMKTNWVIVATSNEPEDDRIQNLCQNNGVECYRGSNRDLYGRLKGCVEKYDITHYIEFSGDSPFVDIRPAKRILELMVVKPNFDIYYPEFYPAGILGIMCIGRAITYLKKIGKYIYDEHDFEEEQEQPNFVENRYKNEFSRIKIPTYDLYNRKQTPINLCIDYSLQLAIANFVVKKLGGQFPLNYDDVEKVYRNTTTLE